MPRYQKKKPDYKGFQNAKHIMQYLTKTSKDSKDWKYFQNQAKKHKQDKLYLSPGTLKKIQTKHPRDVAKDVLLEMKRHSRNEPIGGGILRL